MFSFNFATKTESSFADFYLTLCKQKFGFGKLSGSISSMNCLDFWSKCTFIMILIIMISIIMIDMTIIMITKSTSCDSLRPIFTVLIMMMIVIMIMIMIMIMIIIMIMIMIIIMISMTINHHDYQVDKLVEFEAHLIIYLI